MGEAADRSAQRLLLWLEQGYLFDMAELIEQDELGRDCYKRVQDWPVAARVHVQVVELGPNGRPVKVKMEGRSNQASKLGRELGLFAQRVDVHHTHSLADRLSQARARVLDRANAPEGGGGGDLDGPRAHPYPPTKVLKISQKAGPDAHGPQLVPHGTRGEDEL